MRRFFFLAVVVTVIVIGTATSSMADVTPITAKLTLSAGDESVTCHFRNQSPYPYTEYVMGTGNVHIAFNTGVAMSAYCELLPTQYRSSSHAFAYVWVDPSYTAEYVDVPWTITESPDDYSWTAWENSVGGYPDFNVQTIGEGQGIFHVKASTIPFRTYGAEYLGFQVSTVPEPASIAGILTGLLGLLTIRRRKT